MLRHAGSPDLYTRRLHLRAYRPEDYRQMFDNWAGDPEVTRFLSWGPHANAEITRQLVAMWVEGYQSPTVYRWGIERDGELIGDISVTRWREEEESCEIGYCLCRRYWSQGIMTEALGRVIAELEEIRDARRKPCDGPFYGCPESEYVRCKSYVPPEERDKEKEKTC